MFLWGAATSSHQIEGFNEKNDWWAWEQEGNCEGGVRSGAACDHLHRFREDLRLAADLGLNSYRFSVEWSRIEPEEGKYDEGAIEWYRELIAECERLKLVPMLTLHHFTSPKWFADGGGFTRKRSADQFAAFTEFVVRRLGANVPLWCTFNEPGVLVSGTYLGCFMPPAKYAPKHLSLACTNILRAHVRAYRLIHSRMPERTGPWKDMPLQVGIAHNMLDFMPDRPWHPIEKFLTGLFKRFYNDSWLDAVTGGRQHFGIFGLIPKALRVKEAMGQKTCDFIGVNYYTKAYVQFWPRNATEGRPNPLPIGVEFARRKEPSSDLKWAVHPEGFLKVIRKAASYGLPIYITENGIADHKDALRPDYLLSHLKVLDQARAEGIDIRGYYHWSLLDNFEWVKGFWPRFGLYKVDFETFERTPTRSAQLLRQLIADYQRRGADENPAELLISKEFSPSPPLTEA